MSEHPSDLGGWIDHLSESHTANERMGLLFYDCHIEVRSNSRTLLEKLAYYYKDFTDHSDVEPQIRVLALEAPAPETGLDFTIKQPDPGKTKIKEEWIDFPDGRIVHKRLTGMHFLFGGDRHLAFGPCVENDNQVVNFINNRFIQHSLNRGFLLGHAAAVMHGQRGLSFAGFSGMGKSTLALWVMARGTTFVSNDRLMIRRAGGVLEMLGVPKLPRINPGTILANEYLLSVMPSEERAEAAALPEDELWNLEQKYDAFIDQCFGPGKFRLRSVMSGLVILNWEREEIPLEIRRVDVDRRRDLLGAFMKSVGLFYEPDADDPDPDFSEAAYLECLQDCPVFEFTGGVDFDAAADACMRFLETGAMQGALDRRGAEGP